MHTLRWAIEGRTPDRTDQLNTFLAPWRVASIHLILWGIGTALLTTVYGLADSRFIPQFLFSVGFSGLVVAAGCYLLAEFALRPVAAQVLEAGRPPRFSPGIMGRTLTVWLLGSGIPMVGILLAAVFALSLQNASPNPIRCRRTNFGGGRVGGRLSPDVDPVLAHHHARPRRRAALKHVEQGDLDCNVVVFDGTELGEVQRRVQRNGGRIARARTCPRSVRPPRRAGGRRCGRAATHQAGWRGAPRRGGLRRHDRLDAVGNQPPAGAVVDLLNRFFAVIVEEVDRHYGLVNKFEGDAALAVFGAPVTLDHPEDEALVSARSIAERLHNEVPNAPQGLASRPGRSLPAMSARRNGSSTR